MNHRIKELRSKMLNLSQEQFGNKIGLSKSGISNIESGVRNVTDKHIKLICSEFGVREEWLRTGTGEPFTKTNTVIMEQLRLKYSLNDFDYNFVYEYLKLSPEKRLTVREFFHKVIMNENEYIEKEVDKYRQELELEVRQDEESSASDITKGRKNA